MTDYPFPSAYCVWTWLLPMISFKGVLAFAQSSLATLGHFLWATVNRQKFAFPACHRQWVWASPFWSRAGSGTFCAGQSCVAYTVKNHVPIFRIPDVSILAKRLWHAPAFSVPQSEIIRKFLSLPSLFQLECHQLQFDSISDCERTLWLLVSN